MLLLFPLLFLAWLSETPTARVYRLRIAGWSQQRIADHLGLSRYKVRKLLAKT
jgi:DNA-binding transcriptional regulator LsrR (DeoR family)